MSSTALPPRGGHPASAVSAGPMQGPPALPRLTGPAEGWDGHDDPPSDPADGAGTKGPPRAASPTSWGGRSVTALWSVAYVLTGLFTAIAAIVLVSVALGGFFSLPALGVGALLLTPAIWGSWGLSRGERHRIAAFLGVDIGEPAPSTAPRWLRTVGLDQPRLKALGWAGLHALWGLVSATLLLALASQALTLATLPLWGWTVPQVRVLWLVPVSTGAWSLSILCGIGLHWCCSSQPPPVASPASTWRWPGG